MDMVAIEAMIAEKIAEFAATRLEPMGVKFVKSSVEHALNYAGEHLPDGFLKEEALKGLNAVKDLLGTVPTPTPPSP